MTTKTVPVTAYSIQKAKANTSYGQLSVLPVQSGAAAILLRASLAGIPAGATLNSVKVQFWLQTQNPNAVTLNLQQINSAWSTSTTWATRPGYNSTVIASASATAPVAWGTLFEFDITASAQSMVTGGVKNQGWQISATNAAAVRLAGVWNANNKPQMVIDYSMAPPAPTNLHPSSDAVSVASPTVTFTGSSDMTALQVQVDPNKSTTAPGFDSGTVGATSGQLSLTNTAYTGLALNATTYWRARQRNDFGWGPWSDWAKFSRTAKGVVAIIAPGGATVADGSPPIAWTFSGTQVAWEARLVDKVTGKFLADSGVVNGTQTAWDPTTGLTYDGQQAILSVWAWDNVARASTPGDPVYSVATKTITLSLDSTIAAMSTLEVTPTGILPSVTLTGTRTVGIPDEVVIYRGGAQIARMPGTNVFSGNNFAWTDWTATPNVPVTYRVAPVVNGAIAKGGPTVTVTPNVGGMWLISEDDVTQRAVIWSGDAQDQTQPELSVVHTPAATASGSPQVIRRRLNRMPPQGTMAGTLIDAAGQSAAASEVALRIWADPGQTDAGATYRLVMGNQNLRVIIGDLNFSERPDNAVGQRTLDVSLNWYGRV